MKTKLFFSLLCLAIAFSVSARHITEDEALAKAKSFMGETKLKSTHKGFMTLSHKDIKSQNVNYYVFSKGENAGFVIVSGSDKTDDILGYVDSGNFDKNNIPENMANWLEGYAREIEYAESSNFVPRNNSSRLKASEKTVNPLLTNIMWDQGSPYNDNCPTMPNGEHCATGCVATSFAQIMYYYQWPEKGVGSNSYTSETNHFNLSADFSKSTYEWSKMSPIYNSTSSAESRVAVAKLMSDVGIAFNMDYGPESGTGSHIATGAMAKYFQYDERVNCIYRDYFTRDDWEFLIKTELNNSRPISYSGAANGGGHQFILDGYDANNMFHVNWGWGGYCNGYFKISALNPDGQGIGGFEGGYNSGQTATIGLMKPDASVELPHFCSMYAEDFFINAPSVDQGKEVDFSYIQFWNLDFRRFKGNLNIGFYNEKGELVARGGYNYSGLDFSSFYGMGDGSLKTVFNYIPDGVYSLCMIVKPEGSSEWEKVNMKTSAKKVTATVNGNTITFNNESRRVNISVSNIVIGESYEGFKTDVKYTINNSGDEYDKNLFVAVYSTDDRNVPVFNGKGIKTPIINGESLPVETIEEFGLPAGNYLLAVKDDTNVYSDYVEFTVLPRPEMFNLEVTEITTKNPMAVFRHDFNLNVKIKNNGGMYQNVLLLCIYSDPSFSKLVHQHQQKGITLPGNGRETEVPMTINTSISTGRYYAVPAYINSGGYYVLLNKHLEFMLVESVTGVEAVEADDNAFTVYPNPAEDVLNISAAGTVDNVSVYNMNGALIKHSAEATIDVSELASGNYIVVAEIDGKPSAKTFIKK